MVDELIREEMLRVEENRDPLERIKGLANICSSILPRNRVWGAELCEYIREQINTLPANTRLRLLGDVGCLIYKADKRMGKRFIMEAVRILEDYGDDIDDETAVKIINVLGSLRDDPQMDQLRSYITEIVAETSSPPNIGDLKG